MYSSFYFAKVLVFYEKYRTHWVLLTNIALILIKKRTGLYIIALYYMII